MALNVGYLTANNNKESDSMFTPYYAVDPIMKYIPKDKTVWTPFDLDWSSFYQSFRGGGYNVVRSHIDEGKDFFTYEPEEYDVIVSNPPFSLKDKVLQRLYELDKPFAILLPLNSLQGKSRYKYFKQGIQLLSFDQRVGYHNLKHMDIPVEGSPFATAYFCRDVLPRDLIVEKLNKYEKSLIWIEVKFDWEMEKFYEEGNLK